MSAKPIPQPIPVFERGGLVRLKLEGSPTMLILGRDKTDVWHCFWFDKNNQGQSQSFPAAVLEMA